MYRRSGYRRSGYRKTFRGLSYGKGYQTSSRSRISLRVPVTQVIPLSFNSAIINTAVAGSPAVYSISSKAQNTTRVASIFPWMWEPDTSGYVIGGAGDTNHPALPGGNRQILPGGNCPVVKQKLYQTYCDLYDEVKLDGMTVTLSILDPLGSATLPSMSIATGWDRKATVGEIFEWYDYKKNLVPAINNNNVYPAAASPGLEYNLITSGEYPRSYEALISGPNSSEATAINNSIAKITRSCKASDLLERNTFHDCSLTYGPGNDGATYVDKDWYSSSNKCNFFAPCFYFALKINGTNASAATTVNVQAEVNYYFTFRNPKFGGDVYGEGSAAVARAANSMRAELAAARAVSLPPAAATAAADEEEEDLEHYHKQAKKQHIDTDSVLAVEETVSLDASVSNPSSTTTNGDTSNIILDETTHA